MECPLAYVNVNYDDLCREIGGDYRYRSKLIKLPPNLQSNKEQIVGKKLKIEHWFHWISIKTKQIG